MRASRTHPVAVIVIVVVAFEQESPVEFRVRFAIFFPTCVAVHVAGACTGVGPSGGASSADLEVSFFLEGVEGPASVLARSSSCTWTWNKKKNILNLILPKKKKKKKPDSQNSKRNPPFS